MRTATVGVGCAAIGLVAGVLVSRIVSHSAPARAAAQPNPPAAAEGAPRTPAAAGVMMTRLSDEDKGALRRILREELLADRAAHAAPVTPQEVPDSGCRGRPEPESAPMSDAALQAYDRARTTVDGAISRGVWTESDRAELRAELAAVPAERRFEITSPLIVAVNTQKVRFAGRGPLI
jgi:hypothetical protein